MVWPSGTVTVAGTWAAVSLENADHSASSGGRDVEGDRTGGAAPPSTVVGSRLTPESTATGAVTVRLAVVVAEL